MDHMDLPAKHVHADFITSVTGAYAFNGSYLWSGDWIAAPTWGYQDWRRLDLYPGTVKYVAGDFLRGGYDDICYTTIYGSFCDAGTYNGYAGWFYSAWTFWDMGLFSISDTEWFGR
jgi:hypothetical protein